MADASGATWAWTMIIQVLALIPTCMLLRTRPRPAAALGIADDGSRDGGPGDR